MTAKAQADPKQREMNTAAKHPSSGDFRRNCATYEENAAIGFERSRRMALASMENGVWQRKLEGMSGVRQPLILRIEHGRSAPRVDSLFKLMALLSKAIAIVPIRGSKDPAS